MGIVVRRVVAADLELLCGQPEGLFDNPVDRAMAEAFLRDPGHEMVAAFEGDLMVSFASGTVLLHPDKARSMFINEVGTRDSHLRQGWAKAVTTALIELARELDCEDGMWLGTEPENGPALGLYRKLKGDEQMIVGFAWDGAFDAE